jgi:parallel beta-helix repeat protein
MSVFTVANLNDSGAGSLRAAITAANADSGSPTVINFSVNGTITLASGLPAITHEVAIDATSESSHVSGGPPVVEINCNNNAGLTFAPGSDGSQLLGVAVANANGNGVTLESGNITLNNNYIGLDLAGNAAGNSGDGLFIATTSSNNLIGLNPTLATGVVGNVISGNGGNGISFHGSSGNTLVCNRIGTDPTGTTAIANVGNGLWLTAGASGNQIGGIAFTDPATGAVNDPTGNKGTTTPVFVVPPQGNLISGNSANGVLIDSGSQNNMLNGNFVGTSANGDAAIGNTLDGVAVVNADNNSLVGCQSFNLPFVYYNVLSGNGGNGLSVTDSNNTVVQGNFLGTAANNSTVLANNLDGILVQGTSANTTIGGVIPLGNVSAGNGQNGIEVRDTASNLISFNTFGGLFAFGGAAPNGNDGMLITSTGGSIDVQTNVFSGNTHNGIEIGGNASGVTVEPNIVGLDTEGTALLHNGGDGLLIDGTAHNNTVGGSVFSVIPQNTFSGNLGYGIELGAQSFNNVVIASDVGTSSTGKTAMPNQKGGIIVDGTSHDDTIGGLQPGSGNLISGNIGNGVTLAAGTGFISVVHNTIGFDKSGQPLPNTGTQLVVDPGSTNDTVVGNVIACFAAGTRITTERGMVAVESLQVGDRVRTVPHARFEPVIWIAHRHVDCLRHPDPRQVHPVRIAAHSFGRGLPKRDMFLSPDHAVFVNGVLIPVKYLINGRGIRQIAVRQITYYHVELPRHAVLLAEGLPAETYLDVGYRDNFDNNDGSIRLFADFSGDGPDIAILREGEACAPFVVHGPELDAVREAITVAERRIVPRPQRAGSRAKNAATRRHQSILEPIRRVG